MVQILWPLASIFITLMYLLALATAQSYCLNNDYYDPNSTYEANLETLFTSLPANVDNSGFYNSSAGQSPDTIYATVLCRGDVQPERCRGCIKDATAQIVETCPNYKQAVLFNEFCTLRYSDESMFGTTAMSPEWATWNEQDASDQFMADVRGLLDDLRGRAAVGGSLMKVAVGNRSTVDFQIVFSLVQCTPDLSPDNCSSCLIGAAADIPRVCNSKRACEVLRPSCNLRFGDSPFYNETRLHELQVIIAPPPPPPPSGPPKTPAAPGGKKDNKNRIMIIVFVSIGACLVLVVCASILLIKIAKEERRRKFFSPTSHPGFSSNTNIAEAS